MLITGNLSWYNTARFFSLTSEIKGDFNFFFSYFLEFAKFSRMSVHTFNNRNKTAAWVGLDSNVETWDDDRVCFQKLLESPSVS